MRKVLVTAILAVVVCCVPGCGTLLNMNPMVSELPGMPVPGSIYGGLQRDLAYGLVTPVFVVEDPLTPKGMALACAWHLLWALDLPLSTAADTATLPITIPVHFMWSLNYIDDGEYDGRPWWRSFWQVDLCHPGEPPIPVDASAK